jgi:hypothetical protein
MANLRKILIIIFSSLAGLYLLVVFVLVSFPYHALVARLDQYLRSSYNTGIGVERISYRYPFKLYLSDARVVHEGSSFVLSFDELIVRARFFVPRRMKTLELRGSGIEVRSQMISLTGGSANLEAKFRPLPLLRGVPGNHVASVQFLAGGADVGRVLVAGFEFKDLRLKQAQVFLQGSEEGFTVERGLLSADVVRTELEGNLGMQSMDLLIRVILTDEFNRKFSDLRSIVNTVFRNGTLQVRLQGTVQNPRFRVVQ